MSDTIKADAVGEQLSALMDGELPHDELRFLLRRFDGDAPLTQRWARYQVARAVLRRQGAVRIRADFADVLMQRLASEAVPAVARGPRVLRWLGGGAIAASVAVLALVLTRPPLQAPNDMVASAPTAAPATAAPAARTLQVLPMSNPALSPDYAQPAAFETQASPYGMLPYGAMQYGGANPAESVRYNLAHGTPLLVPVPERRQPEATPQP